MTKRNVNCRIVWPAWLLAVMTSAALLTACAGSTPEASSQPQSEASPPAGIGIAPVPSPAAPTLAPAAEPAPTSAPAPTIEPTAELAAEPAATLPGGELKPGEPAPQPTSAAPNWAAIVRAELERLPVGRILFNPPSEMKLGQAERVEARIAENETPALAEGLKGRGAPQIEPIQVSSFMKARLVGDAFEITALNEAEQLVAGDTFTEWAWDVTPIESGDQTLNLVVTVRILLPEVGEETRDYPVMDRSIHVQVDPVYSTQRFLSNNWQWLASALFIPIVAWGVKSLLDRRKPSKSGGQSQ